MKLDFLERVPYVCERWAEVAGKDPAAVFLTEELSGNSYSREQVDDLSARVYAWLMQKEVGAEDFVQISLPRDVRPFIAMLGVWKAGAAFTVVENTYAPERIEAIRREPRRSGGSWQNMSRGLSFLCSGLTALYRDLKVLGGASPNQIKPVHVIKDGKLKRFFFGLLQK